MTNTIYTHAAFNLGTGEIFATTRACALRHHIARNTAWDRAHGFYAPSRWVFAHGDNALDKVKEKALALALVLTEGGAR